MRANTLARPEIWAVLKNFVLLELYTDNGDATDDANAKLESDKFGTVATPFYAILDLDERLVDKWDQGKTDNAAAYLAWLQGAAQKAPAPPNAASPAAVELPQLTTLEGTPMDTASLNGKVVVVNFWATWCIPCV